MLNNKSLLGAVALLSISSLSIAAPLSHDNVQFTYSKSSSDDIDFKGFSIEGQKQLTRNIFLGGGVVRVSDDSGLSSGQSITGTVLGVSINALKKLSASAEVYGGFKISRVKTEIDNGFVSEDTTDTAKDIYAGVGFSNNSAYQLNFEIERAIDGDDDDDFTSFDLSGRYFMTTETSVGLGYEWDTDDDDYSAVELSVRYDFN